MRDRRVVSTAVARLAGAARKLPCRIEDRHRASQELFAAFREATGETVDEAHAGEDIALAVASLAVVFEYWEITSQPRVSQAVEFAARNKVCEFSADFVAHLRTYAGGECDVMDAARDLAQVMATCQPVQREPLLGFVEPLLATFDPQRRRALGVYFTPVEAVNFLVKQSDRALRQRFHCPRGLADDRIGSDSHQPLAILDPAMGTGIFLIAAIRRMRATIDDDWSQFISDSLLPRLFGCEILPAPFVVANFLIAMELVTTGYVPRPGDHLRLTLGDCLAVPGQLSVAPRVVLGNPPYRGISSNERSWISRLLHGEAPDGSAVASYFHVDGEKLGERKTWLHDDYVKFFRFAQWQIEQSGAGVVAFLTNHGFLDNPTFRGMRSGLLETFDHVEVVDLHGNVKKSASDGDESIFATAQGMALTVAWRNGNRSSAAIVNRGDLRGARSDKLARLNAAFGHPIAMQRIRATPPHYFFHADSGESHPEYEAGFRLPEIMPVNTTAAVTARDWFVVDIDREALGRRLSEFADLSIPDEVIRGRYFGRTRSNKYPPGDTRGWKLAAARQRLASEPDWQRHIRRCWYRPFDRRWIYWAPWMIDWPRADVMRNMQRGNPVLVCRRQSVRGEPCNFFWIADDIVLDGYIRSDNRGSESIFPLFLFDVESAEQPTAANFSPSFLSACERALRLTLVSSAASICKRTMRPLDLLHYIYALFHSPTYRRRYSSQLCVDFPRVLIPRDVGLFRKLSQLGEQLVAAHLDDSDDGDADFDADVTFTGTRPRLVDAGHPQHADERVHIGGDAWFHPVSTAAWEFRVGAHQVLHKWLKGRRRTMLDDEAVRTYQRMAASVLLTQRIMRRVDLSIEQHGPWPAAFI